MDTEWIFSGQLDWFYCSVMLDGLQGKRSYMYIKYKVRCQAHFWNSGKYVAHDISSLWQSIKLQTGW